MWCPCYNITCTFLAPFGVIPSSRFPHIAQGAIFAGPKVAICFPPTSTNPYDAHFEYFLLAVSKATIRDKNWGAKLFLFSMLVWGMFVFKYPLTGSAILGTLPSQKSIVHPLKNISYRPCDLPKEGTDHL